MNYQCNLEIFEGPLDLLLHLIKEKKMDIYDISIADITRQYLTYLDLLSDINLEMVGDYLVMAAELAKIKSNTLLPSPVTEEDTLATAGEDPRAELMRRLLEYQRYKEAAFELRQKEYDQQQLFTRVGELDLGNSEEELLIEASVFDLLTAFQKVLKDKSFTKNYEIKVTTLSVSDRIGNILEMPYIKVYEVATFYSMYNLTPVGHYFIQVCTTTPCMIRGSYKLVEACKEKISLNENELSKETNCSWMEVECLGACVNAPMMQINDDYYEDLDKAKTLKIIDQILKGETPKPGSYRGRLNSEPENNRKTLIEIKNA